MDQRDEAAGRGESKPGNGGAGFPSPHWSPLSKASKFWTPHAKVPAIKASASVGNGVGSSDLEADSGSEAGMLGRE
eukprot:1782553-Rhodomonas_salina.1